MSPMWKLPFKTKGGSLLWSWFLWTSDQKTKSVVQLVFGVGLVVALLLSSTADKNRFEGCHKNEKHFTTTHYPFRALVRSGCTVWTAVDLSPALITVSSYGMEMSCVTTPRMYSLTAMEGRLPRMGQLQKSAPSQSSGRLLLCTGWSFKRNMMQGSSWWDKFHKA